MYQDLIQHVPDRAGHDARYAIDPSKVMNSLGWEPSESIESGLTPTVDWYIKNRQWWERVLEGESPKVGWEGVANMALYKGIVLA